MQFICLFCPAFISVFLYLKFEKKKSVINTIVYYFLSVLAINSMMLLISKIFFHLNDYWFTISFSIKYITLSCILAVFMFYFSRGINFIFRNRKDIRKNPKKYLELLKIWVINNKDVNLKWLFFITIIINFLIIDVFLRYKSYATVNFYDISDLAPNLFSFGYIFLLAVIVYNLPKIIGRIVLGIWYVIFFVLFIANYMLIAIRNNAFTFYDLTNASEGAAYLNFLLKEINIKLILIIILSIFLFVLSLLFLNKIEKKSSKWKKSFYVLIAIIIMLACRGVAINSLGTYEEENFVKFNIPRYYYDNFINTNRSLQLCGLYEYTIRDLYLYIKESNETFGSKEEIDKALNEIDFTKTTNDKTGIFKGKNLIMIQLESIDNIFINDDTMPALNYMRKNGWNFSGRNSNNISTISTEFVALSGLYFIGNSYTINNNDYVYSLPNVFNENDYITSSVHENNGNYYNRKQFHESLGFQNSYFLYDMLENPLHGNDEQIISNDEVYHKIVAKDKPFMTSIITISAHGPYSNNYYCKTQGFEPNDEHICLNYLSGLTDDMLKTLLNRLDEDGILEDTVIVLYSDHYPYAYSFTEEEIANIKSIDNDKKIRNLPFIIYNSEIESNDYDMLFSDIDIVPTLLNMFGIDYNPKNYVGTDIFADAHKDMNILADYTWYDGNIYSISATNYDEYYNETSKYVQNVLDLNKMMISNNYYGAE